MKYILQIIFTFTLLCSFTINVYSQQHLDFMGISLDGSIDNFQQKLKEKQIVPDVAKNKKEPFGSRWFLGKFNQEWCDFIVYYNNSGNVYRVKAICVDTNVNRINKFYNNTKVLLMNTYKDAIFKDSIYDRSPSVIIAVINSRQKTY